MIQGSVYLLKQQIVDLGVSGRFDHGGVHDPASFIDQQLEPDDTLPDFAQIPRDLLPGNTHVEPPRYGRRVVFPGTVASQAQAAQTAGPASSLGAAFRARSSHPRLVGRFVLGMDGDGHGAFHLFLGSDLVFLGDQAVVYRLGYPHDHGDGHALAHDVVPGILRRLEPAGPAAATLRRDQPARVDEFDQVVGIGNDLDFHHRFVFDPAIEKDRADDGEMKEGRAPDPGAQETAREPLQRVRHEFLGVEPVQVPSDPVCVWFESTIHRGPSGVRARWSRRRGNYAVSNAHKLHRMGRAVKVFGRIARPLRRLGAPP